MRIIGHLDMDAFFAAVEERNNPRFAGLPIAVGADPKQGHGRGIISTANYAARAYGLHSAMPITRAWQASQAAQLQNKPPVIFLPGNWSAYQEASTNIMQIIKQHAPLMQQRSVDEAYFDLSSTRSFSVAAERCRQIKQAVAGQTNLTASIGLGPNKLVAKIASDYEKPDGFTVVTPDQVQSFLDPLPIRAIPGIGPKAAQQLHRHHIKTVCQLRQLSQPRLINIMGNKWGASLYRKARGQDNSPLSEGRIAKSIGRHHTFHDTLDSNFLINKLNQASSHVHQRLANEGFSTFRTIVLTVRFSDFQTQTQSHTLANPSHSLAILKHDIIRRFLPFLDSRANPQHKSIRLIGVRLEKIS